MSPIPVSRAYGGTTFRRPLYTPGDQVHLSSLVIENYRNFQSLVIDPFPPNAVILGENGSGKTNLLEALRLILDPTLPNSQRRLRATDVCEAAGTSMSGLEVRIVIEIQGFDDDDTALGEFDGCIVSDNPITARFTYLWRQVRHSQGKDGGEPPAEEGDFDWTVFGGSNESQDGGRVSKELPLTVLPALRDAVRDLENWRVSPLTDIMDRRPPSPGVVEAALAEISAATDKIAADIEVLDTATRLRDRLGHMSGTQLPVRPTMGVAAGRPEQLVRSLRLFIDDARTRSVADTSTGAANVVYLALLLERLALHEEDDALIDFVLGVEEPEAHLHPSLQRQLFGFLLRRYSALLLTSHSAHIAAVAKIESLVLLRRDRKTGTSLAATVASANFEERTLRDLERYLDVSRAEILFARAVLFVEGIAETYVMRAVAELFGFDLDAWGVVISCVSGTDFAPYRKLCGQEAFDIPHIILTDGDQEAGKGWLGLRRAAPLLGAEAALVNEILMALDATGDDSRVSEARMVCRNAGVMVGVHTMEVDVCGVFPGTLGDAITDLISHAATTDVHGRIKAVANGGGAEARKDLLTTVAGVSKGRLAQRFANRIAAIDRDAFVGHLAGNLGIAEDEFTTESLIQAAGPASYMFEALDAISELVGRGCLYARPRDAQ